MPKEELTILIPCRLNSRRLPKKALRELIGSKTLIELVFENTLKSIRSLGFESCNIFVCTDSEEIENVLKDKSIPCLMTSSNNRNGTERIGECIERYDINSNYIIDVQGDEPFVSSKMLELVINSLYSLSDKYKDLPLIVVPHQTIQREEAVRNSTIKITTNETNRVLYMSRLAIPFAHLNDNRKNLYYKKHLSVNGFTKKALINYCNTDQSNLEKLEDIELLRALENESYIYSPKSDTSSFSIDTLEDLEKAQKILKGIIKS